MVDIRSPYTPSLDFILLGDIVAELNSGIAIESGITLLVISGQAVGVRGDLAVTFVVGGSLGVIRAERGYISRICVSMSR